MTAVCDWLRAEELESICEGIPGHINLPLFAGRVLEDDLSVEAANGLFEAFTGKNGDSLPESLDLLLSDLNGPGDMEPMKEAARKKGWKTVSWPLVPGEVELELHCWSDGERYLAFFHDLAPHLFHSRLLLMKNRFLELINVYDVKGMIPQMLLELVEHLGVDWAGIFVWDGAREHWVLSLEEANPAEFGQEEQRSALTFARDLSEAMDGPCGHRFGGLVIQDGSQWWLPWKEGSEDWEPLMSGAGFESLFAGVLLTGANPALLLCLSRIPGKFARINRDVLESLWPVFLSSAERNRAVEGITRLFTRDPGSGLYARSMMHQIMKVEMDRARRYRYPLSAISVRVSNMGIIREKGGAEAVAETVRLLSREVLKNLRNVDIGGLAGEGEIVLLLPHTPMEGAAVVSGRIRERIAEITPYRDLPLDTEVRATVMSEECGSPEDLLSELGLA